MEREIIELKRAIALLDHEYANKAAECALAHSRIDALISDKAALSKRIGELIDGSAELNGLQRASDARAVEVEGLLQAVERDLDAADVEIAALKAANELLSGKNTELSATIDRLDRDKSELSELCAHYVDYRMDNQSEINALYAENRRLRDVIVHHAMQQSGCGV